MICKHPVTAGFVVCGDCADSIKSCEISPDTLRFIGQLAEEIANDTTISACSLCNYDCKPQENRECSEGVKEWLLDRAKMDFSQGKQVEGVNEI